MNTVKNYLAELERLCGKMKKNEPVINEVADRIYKALTGGKKVIFCGNGGSASISDHLAAEFVGRFEKDRPGMAALSLTSNSAIVTAIANDYGYENVFKRQISSLGVVGDVLICMSTSGMSKNIHNAIDESRKMGITTIAFVGPTSCRETDTADKVIYVQSNKTSMIQEMHLVIGHVICLMVEKKMYEEPNSRI